MQRLECAILASMETRLFRADSYMAPGDAFHAVVKDVARARPRFRHRHDYHELMVVLDGPLRHEVGARAETLPGGTAAFLRPDDAHLLHATREGRARILNVMVRSDAVAAFGARHRDALAGRFFWSRAPAPETVALAPPLRGRVAGAAVALREGPRGLLRLEAFLATLMADLAQAGAALDADLPPWLARACRAAQAPEVFRAGAAGLARASGRSHEHLCRSMRRHMGVSPSAYVNAVRMDHAARLLREGAPPVAEVAEAVGIANLGHFYRLFRLRHGLTPRAYRVRATAAPV